MTEPTAPRAGAGTGYITAGDLNIYYQEQGAGPPLVLLHGGLTTGEIMWGNRIPMLAQHYQVVAPDSRGHGRTNNPAGTLAYDQMAGDVAAFITALGIERPLVLGYSDGAQIALELGLRHPDQARALVLGGVITRPTEKYLATLHAMGFVEPGQVDLAAFEEDPEFLAGIQNDHQHVYGPDYWRSFLPQIGALWLGVPSYTDAALARITLPTLLITGDRDEGDSLEESLRLYRLLPQAELAVIPNADHGAGDTDLFWHAVLGFLARHA